MATTGPFSGQVQNVAVTNATGSGVTAFCRKVSGGTFDYNLNNVRNFGIGAQVSTIKGVGQANLSFTCKGVTAANLAKWFPTTAGVQVADFPAASSGFLVEVDDGTNGQEWYLTGCQPTTCSVALAQGLNTEVEVTFGVVATTATLKTATTATAAYNAFLGHAIDHVTMQVGTANHKIMSFTVNNDLGTTVERSLDTGGDETVATGAYITTQTPTCSFVTRDVYKMALGSTTLQDSTAHLDEDIAIVMANGNASQNITITMLNMVPDSLNMPLEAQGMVGFGHEFGAGGQVAAHPTVYGRVTVA